MYKQYNMYTQKASTSYGNQHLNEFRKGMFRNYRLLYLLDIKISVNNVWVDLVHTEYFKTLRFSRNITCTSKLQ